MFYEMNTSATKSKTIEDFIMSQYYEAFVKFGRACQVNNWLEPEKYTEYLIKNGVKLKQWASDKNYEKYLKEFVKKELQISSIGIHHRMLEAPTNSTRASYKFLLLQVCCQLSHRRVEDLR